MGYLVHYQERPKAAHLTKFCSLIISLDKHMPATYKPVANISPESAEHNKGRMADRLAKYATKPVGKLGKAPKWMSTVEKRIWKKLANAAPSELGESDRTLFEIAVTLKAKLEAHDISTSQMAQLSNAMKSLGYVPVDRKAIEPPAPENPLDRFDS
jgi:hypothetical protein